MPHELEHILKHILATQVAVSKELNHMSKELDALTAQVQANNDLLDSAATMINGIASQIIAAGTDPQKLSDLAVSLKNKDDVLAAAIAANTAPTPPVTAVV